MALSSGTTALHLAMVLLGAGPGDDVLVSTLTFVASANAVCYVGARPVFVDSTPESWNVDPGLLAEEIERRVAGGRIPKAVVTVDLYGQSADYDPIVDICRQYEIAIVQDAAESLGATYRGESVGVQGDLGVFSFNGNKIITTSAGGMLVTASAELANDARNLATQARDPFVHYEHSRLGFNYRMSNLLAALGRAQLGRLDDRIARRRAVNARYRAALGDSAGIAFMPVAGYGTPTHWLTCITVDEEAFGATRDDIITHLESHDIEARPTWKPMHLQPLFAGCESVGGSVSEEIFARGLCLPSGSGLSDEQVDRVAATLLEVPRRAVRRANPGRRIAV